MPKGIKETEEVAVAVHNPEFEEPRPVIKEPEIPTVEVFGEGVQTRVRVFPQIRVGVCEFHGTPSGKVHLDTMKGKCKHVCATDPLCPHAKTGCFKDAQGRDVRRPIVDTDAEGNETIVGYEDFCRHEHNYDNLLIRCSYCPANADFRGILSKRTFYIYSHPEKPNKLIMCCSDYRCVSAHQKRFSRQGVV